MNSRQVCSCFFTLFLAAALSACGKKLPDEIRGNDIITMTPVSKDRMTITIRAEYNVNNEAIRSALAEKFPDVNFVSVFHCSGETQYELRQSLLSGEAEDLIISPNMKAVSDIAGETMLDLSAENFADAYNGQALEGCAVDGKLYYLPGPSALYGIVYDKTLFEQKGWEVPRSYSAFLKLAETIEASGIRAVQPTCRYARQAQMVFTMFNYGSSFGGVDNADWLLHYQNGEGGMQGHLEAALERYRELNAAGIIRPEDFDMQPGNRSRMLYNDHSCAMIIENEQAMLYAEQAGSDHSYGMFPFWCGDGPDDDYLMSLPSYYIGVNARLLSGSNTAKLGKIKEILAYISTPEGQLTLNGGAMRQLSNVAGTPYTKDAFNKEIQEAVLKGNVVPEVDLMASGNNNPVEKALQSGLKEYLAGSITAEELLSGCDAVRDRTLQSGLDRGKKIGTAESSFTGPETAMFIAEALRQKAGADIGLCLAGTSHCGTVSRIYKGDIYAADINSLSLSVGVTNGNKDDKKLWLVSMTGAELKKLLDTGYKEVPQDNVPEIPYYTAAGLRIRFAPWKEDKILSVRLADGSELDDGAEYRVALWGWPFASACPGKVEQVFDDSSNDIITEAIEKSGSIRPSGNGSFTISYQ